MASLSLFELQALRLQLCSVPLPRQNVYATGLILVGAYQHLHLLVLELTQKMERAALCLNTIRHHDEFYTFSVENYLDVPFEVS